MARPETLERLRRAAPAVLPSLLLCDFGNLEREVERLGEAGVEALHLDVMDGQFVPNLTYGMPIVAGLRRLTEMTLDVHLMVAAPERFVPQFVDAGADVITIHVEACEAPGEVLASIAAQQVAAGAAINPDTPLLQLESCLDACDLALVMSVQAGFGGQSFRPEALQRARRIRQLAPEVLLEMDGGLNEETVADAAGAGVQLLVAGSAIFRRDDYRQAVASLKRLAGSSPA